MNRKKKTQEQWLSGRDEAQLKWTYDYICTNFEQKLDPYSSASNLPTYSFESVLAWLQQTELNFGGPDKIKVLRRKWSTYKYRKNPKHKILNLALSPEAARTLKQLQGRRSQRETLEELIFCGGDYKKHYQSIIENLEETHQYELMSARANSRKKSLAFQMTLGKIDISKKLDEEKTAYYSLAVVAYDLIDRHVRNMELTPSGIFYRNATPEEEERIRKEAQKTKEEFFGNRLRELEELIEQTRKTIREAEELTQQTSADPDNPPTPAS